MAATVSRFSAGSPTAQLLRNSRLFAIPPPLPQPVLKEERFDITHSSETATLPYPTQQVIQTPNHLRKQGEWGLKRTLPLKTTRNARGIFLNELDTYDEVTDYTPATHHTKALAKLQELDLALIRRANIETKVGYGTSISRPSAFDEDFDYTAHSAKDKPTSMIDHQAYALSRRWKVRGPNVRDMPEAEFNKFLGTNVKAKAAQFRVELKHHALNAFVEAMHDKAFESSKHPGERSAALWLLYAWLRTLDRAALSSFTETRESSTLDQLSASGFPEKPQFVAYLAEALNDPAQQVAIDQESQESILKAVDQVALDFKSKWEAYWKFYLQDFRKTAATTPSKQRFIEAFFDLPTTVIPYVDSKRLEQCRPKQRSSPSLTTDISRDTGVVLLNTHPSAGLAYRRTDRVLPNHPFYGPLSRPLPHPARVLYPKPLRTERLGDLCVGVGGIAANPRTWTVQQDRLTEPHSESNQHGQGKRWVYVAEHGADVLPSGKVVLQVRRATDSMEYVAENALGRKLTEAKQSELELQAAKEKVDLGTVRKSQRAEPIVMPEARGGKGSGGWVESLVD